MEKTIFIIFMALISFLAVYIMMPGYINFLKRLGFNQEVSKYSLKEFQAKAKTPIMGGLLFILIPTIILLIGLPFIHFSLSEVIVLIAFVGYGAIGFTDDFLIIKRQKNDGLKPRYKLIAQLFLAVIIILIINVHLNTKVHLPFINIILDLGFLYYLLVIIMFAGETNAVNFTDGMDGLCAGTVSIVLFFYGIMAYLAGEYGILAIITTVIASLLAYLKYNFFPAKIFMGDSGSLALGALLVGLSIVLKKELALILLGGTFLIEIMSVIIQITAVKLFKRRVFLYTPIHYSFVKKGMSEKNTVLRFYVLTFILALIGFFVGLN